MKHRLLAIVVLLVAGVFLVECKFAALSPHEEVKPELKPEKLTAEGGSSIWQFNFQSISGKAGWFLPVVVLGWMWTERKKRQTTTALDVVIESIESEECADCKSCVAAKKNKLVNGRVARLKNGPKPG